MLDSQSFMVLLGYGAIEIFEEVQLVLKSLLGVSHDRLMIAEHLIKVEAKKLAYRQNLIADDLVPHEHLNIVMDEYIS